MKTKYELIEEKINTLEMQMEWFDSIDSVQDTINEIAVMLKEDKYYDLQERYDNLIKHFRKVYLGI
jgi:hypothetical protein